MSNNAPGILVIDDDEVVLVAIADLLEAAGFEVRCQSSPAGAADIAAADPNLVAAVVDLNMPIMRGDNVARMFLSRASLRDLPLVLLSGDSAEALAAVRAKMPHVKVVAKSDMDTRLVPVIQDAIAERQQRKGRRAWGSEPSVEVVSAPAGAAGAAAASRPDVAFFEQLGREVELAREVWREVRAGRTQRLGRLLSAVRTLQGDADKLALFQIALLLRGIEQIGTTLQHGYRLRPAAEVSVEKAIDALASASQSRGAGPQFVTSQIVDSLRRAAADLRSTREDG